MAAGLRETFTDALCDRITAGAAPVCVGLDPAVDKLPAELRPDDPSDALACVRAIDQFCRGVLSAVAEHATVVKIQSAYFEKYHAPGVDLYYQLVAEAHGNGLLVIGDIKRGDIGSTSEAYADAHLGAKSTQSTPAVVQPATKTSASERLTTTSSMGAESSASTSLTSSASSAHFAPALLSYNHDNWPDAITVNPFMGVDTIEPFLAAAERAGKALFVLVRTSNPGSADVQDALLQSGLTVSEHLAELLRPMAGRAVGRHGYGTIGAVVGATQPQTMHSLRRRLPNSIFLLPGYGAQGATAQMTRAAFDDRGLGAIVSASRSVLYPTSQRNGTWQGDIEAAARAFAIDVKGMLNRDPATRGE